jgi:alpha-tubulin suppressor-like RCC1 family protein
MRRRTWVRSALALFASVSAGCTALVGVDHDYTLAPGDDATSGESGVDAPGDASGDTSVDRAGDAGDSGSAGDGGASDSGPGFPVDAGAVSKVVAGKFHTCAFFQGTGVAKCWGRNDDYFELGNGSMTSTAVPLYAMTPGLTDLFAGAHDTCGVSPGGGECAGKGGLGELADDVVDADSPQPEPTIAFPSAPTQIASGEAFTCALVAGGAVWCVGDGELGQLGNGSYGISATAVQVQLGAAATKVAAFYQHACALLVDGTVACWGDDSTGALGNGSFTPDAGAAMPEVVSGLPHAIDVGVGEGFSCSLVDGSGGSVWCWGDNSYGELGNGSNTPSATPVEVQGTNAPSLLAVGGGHACAASLDQGGIVCWGHGSSGELGDGNGTNSQSPVSVANVGGYPESLAVGGFHTCALFAAPDVRCWGSDDFGQLGDGKTNMDEDTPVPVTW